MRASSAVLLTLALLAACSQAPVNPAPAQAQSAPAAATHAAPAPVQAAPPPVALPPAPPAPAAPPLEQIPADKDHPLVKIETNLGDMVVQLDATRAPLSVKNFLMYVKERYYDNSGFYRVVPGFVIQGGDFTPELKYHQPKHPAVANEAGNGFNNQRGSIAMARDDNPHSANATFYINVADNTRRLGPRPDRWGYAVFGQVVQGLDVMDKIAAVQTHTVTLQDKYHETFNDVPVQAVHILKVTLLPLDAPKP